MWTNVEQPEYRGQHSVYVPEEFGKTMKDFPSTDEFLRALREFHDANTKRSLA